jgi:hypothetical protein
VVSGLTLQPPLNGGRPLSAPVLSAGDQPCVERGGKGKAPAEPRATRLTIRQQLPENATSAGLLTGGR